METKIPFYNVVNMLLTGFVFIGGIIVIFPVEVIQLFENPIIKNLSTMSEILLTFSAFALVYEIGLLINRIGAIFLEPILKKTKFIPFDNDYNKFTRKKIEFPTLGTLSREYALSRTQSMLFLILVVICLILTQWLLSGIFFIILIIYFFSCRKYAKKIVGVMAEV